MLVARAKSLCPLAIVRKGLASQADHFLQGRALPGWQSRTGDPPSGCGSGTSTHDHSKCLPVLLLFSCNHVARKWGHNRDVTHQFWQEWAAAGLSPGLSLSSPRLPRSFIPLPAHLSLWTERVPATETALNLLFAIHCSHPCIALLRQPLHHLINSEGQGDHLLQEWCPCQFISTWLSCEGFPGQVSLHQCDASDWSLMCPVALFPLQLALDPPVNS